MEQIMLYKKRKLSIVVFSIYLIIIGCQGESNLKDNIKLITLDPGHFHAALIQKSMYQEIDAEVFIYAPEGQDLDLHLQKIHAYNTRKEKPTKWISKINSGPDYLNKMITEKNGNVVVISGNNKKKTDYILAAIENGFNIYADKPMVISPENYPTLKRAFQIAKEKNLIIYDIMTERSEITTRLQKEFAQNPEVFGKLITGSEEEPAITKESIHHFFKYVSGQPLIRPGWFFDTRQQGEGIADVTSHLVDLTFWECFPEEGIKPEDIQLKNAKRWPTIISKKSFEKITQKNKYPTYLQDKVHEDSLSIYANGSIDYRLKGHYAKVSVKWEFQAAEGAGDLHYSIMRGTKANLVIEQGPEQQFIPTLYLIPGKGFNEEIFLKSIDELQTNYPKISAVKDNNRFKIKIPEKLRVGHEAHFAEVTKRFIEYYKIIVLIPLKKDYNQNN
jgi:predicted dehydrogenase